MTTSKDTERACGWRGLSGYDAPAGQGGPTKEFDPDDYMELNQIYVQATLAGNGGFYDTLDALIQLGYIKVKKS